MRCGKKQCIDNVLYKSCANCDFNNNANTLLYNALLPLSRYSHCFGKILVFVLNPSTTWKYLYCLFYKNCMFVVFESFLNFFLVCYPADLGELCESQPSSDALREGDCQRRRKPLTERHAVQPGPAEHLHTDGKTGELSDRNTLNIRLTWTQRLHSVHTHCIFLFRCCVRPEWHRTHALKKGEGYILPSLAFISSMYPQYSSNHRWWHRANNALVLQL